MVSEMTQQSPSLEDIRREIDAVDDAIHNLLMRRAEMTSAIGRLKNAQPGAPATLASVMRPAREAAILRRLLAQHGGSLPARSVVRIWREIIAASLLTQGQFTVHVPGGETLGAFHDLARAYFGSLVPIHDHTRVPGVFRACAEDANALGIVPVPEAGETGLLWWMQLASPGEKGPRIIAKLPFVNDDDATPPAYVLASIEQESSGDDTTLILVETDAELSRTRLQALWKAAGFQAVLIAAGSAGKAAPGSALLEVQGFVGPTDPRLATLTDLSADAIKRATPVGGFANAVSVSSARQQ
jgi:chorismate mutase-like protein